MFSDQRLADLNQPLLAEHQTQFQHLADAPHLRQTDVQAVVQKLIDFQVAIPSWALGTGGTRFGRFPLGGEPATLEDKISDVGILQALNRSSPSTSTIARRIIEAALPIPTWAY